jgi:hypothetical protein
MKRSYTMILILFFFFPLLSQGGASQVGFTAVTMGYTVSGELCYDQGGFVESFPVLGEMRVTLDLLSLYLVEGECSCYINNTKSNTVYESVDRTDLYANRVDVEGNFSPFYIEFPLQESLEINTFHENVKAMYLGVRFVRFHGKYIKTHCYCYCMAELQNVLRCEWYFDYNAGVLLRFVKSVEMNFIRVQWIDYLVKNTTLSLPGSHPISAFFANYKESFYAVVGASIIVVMLFFILIQKKAGRCNTP